MKRLVLPLMAVILLSGCVNDDDYSTPNLECIETTLVKTMEPQEINATTDIQEYEDDDVIEAYVVSSDKGGNFFKSLSFQTLDGSFAFSVPVDANSLFINFEPGRKVLIKLKDTYNQIYNGSLEIGGINVSMGFAVVGRLSPAEYKEVLNRSCTVLNEEELLQHPSIPELQNDRYINKLVELSNVQFSNEAVGNTYYDASNDTGGGTDYLITDEAGNTLIFRTSAFANFGADSIPPQSGSIRGILTKYQDTYQFMVRTEKDIRLNQNRF